MKNKSMADRFSELFESKCEFWEICEYFDKKSVTCTKDGGGEYCGQWKNLIERKEERRKLMRR